MRRRLGAGGAARQGARPRGPAEVGAGPPGLPGGALVAAPGRARPAAAWGRPAGPLLGRGEGGPRARDQSRQSRQGPRRPVGSGERRQPGTYRGGGGAALGRGRTPCRGSVLDTNNVRWPAQVGSFRFRISQPFSEEKSRASHSVGMKLRGASRAHLKCRWSLGFPSPPPLFLFAPLAAPASVDVALVKIPFTCLIKSLFLIPSSESPVFRTSEWNSSERYTSPSDCLYRFGSLLVDLR